MLAVLYNRLPVRWQRRILNRTQSRFLVGVVGLGVDPNGHVVLSFFFQAEDGIRDLTVTGVQTCALPIYLSTIYTGIAVCFATGLLPLQLLGTWVNIGTLLAFVLVCAGVWILRSRRPDLHRPFRTPWVPAVPMLGIVCCVGLMLTLPVDTWIRLGVWLMIGLAIYFAYGRKHSLLQRGV